MALSTDVFSFYNINCNASLYFIFENFKDRSKLENLYDSVTKTVLKLKSI